MSRNTANRPSQSNQEYVLNSKGEKVRNLAYKGNNNKKKDLNINRKIIQTIAQLEEDDIHQLCLLDDLQLKNTLYARFKE